MNFKYETQGTNTYLVYTIQPGDVVDTMGLGMLTNNKIPGLAATQYTQMDTARYVMFNVSAKIPVSQFFSGPVNRKRLIGVFKGITSALISAEDYMIDANSILLDLEYIFTDVSSCETILICLPVQQNHPPVNLGQFFKNIMFSTQFDQAENCDYVAKIMNYLNSTPAFSVYDFNLLMDQLQQGAAPVPVPITAQQPATPKNLETQANGRTFAPGIQPQVPVQAAQQQPQMPAAVKQPAVNITPTPQTIPSVQQPMQQGMNMMLPQGFPPPQQPMKPMAGGQGAEKQSFLKKLFKSEKGDKNQKEAKQNAAAVPNMQGAPAAAPEKGKKEKKEKSKKGAQQPNFAVPGQQPNFAVPGRQPNFAVPGQQPNFAVPGQQPNFAVPGQQPNFAVPGQKNAVPSPAAGKNPPIPQGVPNGQPGYQQPQQAMPRPMQQPVRQPGYQQPAPQPMQQAMPQPSYQQPAPQNAPQPQLNFGETTVLGGGIVGETTVLGEQPQQQTRPHLIRVKNNEQIMVNKPVFRIGKERSYVDYFVADNPAISRSHANIITRDGNYFIMDTNSTNHTYVNGGMIQSNAEIKISHGTKICLANEEFEFKLY